MFSRDTSPEARKVLAKRMREMTVEEKARQVWSLTNLVRQSSLAGLRGRHPGAPEDEIRRRFVALDYGREVARRMYGRDLAVDERVA